MLKYFSKNALKIIQNNLLFSKKAVIYPANSDRRSHNNDDTTKRTDNHIQDSEDKFVLDNHIQDREDNLKTPLEIFEQFQ